MSTYLSVVAVCLTVFTRLGAAGSIPVSVPSRIFFKPMKTPALFTMSKRLKFSTAWLQKFGHLLSNLRPHERSWPYRLA